ncbi:glycoside hydrolase family 68 protein [Lactobacillus crispatus]|uniref:glycoside hydrolase family 68 protein n=1 Tax=Lactobacillus crispatus TaxID=47770 RepID=UPI000B5D9A3D|nr:glycoside hydrolase family 68 protein [Lactobacillus crispatus]OXC12859.1 levansucrase [Lactobacillus crispatus]OXC15671.1 levansucrase [Lactobacillus crispatus]OXC22068.1 levansucrase [Lactobacillus crispatus]
MNKRSTLVTFASAAVLLGLFNINNSQTVKADTVEQPTTDQRNTQTTTANDQNGKSDQDQTQTGQNTAATTDQTQNQTDQNNTAADNTNNAGNQNNTGAADTDTTNANQDTQNQVGGFTDTTQSTNDYASNSVSDTSYVQNNDAVVYNLDPQTVQMLRAADVNPKDLTEVQLKEVRKLNFNDLDKDTSTRWTYDQYAGVAKKMIDQDARYRVPYFNAKKIKNMPATVTRDAQTGKVAELEIWDSWSVQDAKTGRVVNYKGYQLMIAMMGIPQQNDAHIYLLYNKYNDNNFNHWKCAGPIFGFNAKPTDQEWSGSATMNKDGSIQLFYTDVDTREGTNHQKISTVNLKLKVNKKKNTISIAKRSHRHVLFQGDGYYYQTYKQWKSTNKGADNIAMRDAHVISVGSKRYLIFEASTGSNNYQGADQVYNWKNYGGTPKEALQNFLKVTANDDMKSRATWSNAAIGIIRLTKNENNPKVAEVLPPLVNSLMVSDEIERPNIIPMNGKYYLFATTRLNRGTGDDLWQQADAKVGDNVAMLGWVSDHLTYGYRPLNGDAAVLVASVPFNWRTSTYSYYAVPVKGNKKEVLVTSYMTNRGFASGPNKRSTMAPAFLVRIDGDTTKVENIATAQGDWVYDKKSKRKSMIAKNIRGARLKGEPIDHSLLKNA